MPRHFQYDIVSWFSDHPVWSVLIVLVWNSPIIETFWPLFSWFNFKCSIRTLKFFIFSCNNILFCSIKCFEIILDAHPSSARMKTSCHSNRPLNPNNILIGSSITSFSTLSSSLRIELFSFLRKQLSFPSYRNLSQSYRHELHWSWFRLEDAKYFVAVHFEDGCEP